MNTKIVLLGIAIVSIGLFALPQTMALFVGQHDWYDTTPAGIQIPCLKCHGDIVSELTQPGTVNALHRAQAGPNPDGTGGCYACHVTVAPVDKEGLTRGGADGNKFHAAAAPMCLDCHGAGLTTGPGVDARSILTGPDEVHKPFATQAGASTAQLLKGANEACVACHTHIKANIEWTKATTIEFKATEDGLAPDAPHTWIVNNFKATGTATVTTTGGP